METSKIIKNAKMLNIIEIVVTIAYYVALQIENKIWVPQIMNMKQSEQVAAAEKLIAFEGAIRIALGVVSVGVIIFTIILIANNAKKVKGLGLLLASGIVTLAFAVIGAMIGLIIWCLSGASLTQLKKQNAADDFEAKIQNEMNMMQNTSVNNNDTQN